MRSVVDAAQSLAVDVAVDLRRRERAVAEQLLNRPQIRPAFQQMRCERVTQSVRMREEASQRRRVEPAAARRHEERVLRITHELRARLVQIACELQRGLLAERHDALLAALAADVKLLLLEVDVREVEIDGLAASQAGRGAGLQESAVAN